MEKKTDVGISNLRFEYRKEHQICSVLQIIIYNLSITKRSSLPENVRAESRRIRLDLSRLESFPLHSDSSLPLLERSEQFPVEKY